MTEKAPLTPQDSVSAQPEDEQDHRPRREQGLTLWFTGLSGSGKSALSQALAPVLRARGRSVEILDGDEVREHISKGLGFSREDRDLHIKRLGWLCRLLNRHGAVAISAAISPYRAARDENRRKIRNFIEIYVECPIEVLRARDPKGLYEKALAGEIQHFTGVSDPYEPPERPELHIHSDRETPEESLARIVTYLQAEGWIT